MSTRAFWMACLLVCVAGCPGADEAAPSLPTNASVPAAELLIESEAELRILPTERPVLSVRYVVDGKGIAGREVEFGLLGSAEGASLESVREITDADGIAKTRLVAGRTAPAFQVRASALGLSPVYFEIEVLKPSEPTVNVVIAYSGERAITTNTVVWGEGKCDQRITGSVSQSVKPGETVSLELGAGRSYAISAWGSDETNSKLASGCVNYPAPVRASATDSLPPAVVALKDIELSLAKTYNLTLSVALDRPLSSLAPLARSAVSDALPRTTTPQASFLLDALATRVSFATARRNEGLDAQLQALLDANGSGPLSFADALASDVSDDGQTCVLSATISAAGPSADGETVMTSGVVTAPIYAVASYGVANSTVPKELNPSVVALTGPVELRATYEQSSAIVQVGVFKIPLGFGSYVAYLLDNVGQQSLRYAQNVATSSGCTQLGTLVSARASVFSGLSSAEAIGICEMATGSLVPKIRAQWLALDQQRNMISLEGPLSAHDRDGDRTIDDLGPGTLSGDWSKAGVATSADTFVSASARVPTTTASLRL